MSDDDSEWSDEPKLAMYSSQHPGGNAVQVDEQPHHDEYISVKQEPEEHVSFLQDDDDALSDGHGENGIEGEGDYVTTSDSEADDEEVRVKQESGEHGDVDLPELDATRADNDGGLAGSQTSSDASSIAVGDDSTPSFSDTPAEPRKRKAAHQALPRSKKIKTDDDEPSGVGDIEMANNGELSDSEREERNGDLIPDVSREKPKKGKQKQLAKPTFAQQATTPRKRDKNKNAADSSARLVTNRRSQSNIASTSASPSPARSRSSVCSPQEIQRITRVVQKYRDDHGITQEEVNEMIQHPFRQLRVSESGQPEDAHRALWALILTGYSGRQRVKIMRFCRRQFHNFKARGGGWTVEEDEQLAQLVAEGGTQWTKWSTILDRPPDDLCNRYNDVIVCGGSLSYEPWTDREIRYLQRYVEEALAEIEVQQSKWPHDKKLQRPAEQLINWQKISLRFDRTRSRIQCLKKWKALESANHE